MARSSRKVSITVAEWVYNAYLAESMPNKSQYIEELIVAGAECLINHTAKKGFDSPSKAHQIQLLQENQALRQENKKLKLELGKLKDKYSDRMSDKDMQNIALQQTMKHEGILWRTK